MIIVGKSKTLFWTNHAKSKMSFYRLSEQRVRRVLNSPKRVEEGIAPKTIAMMQPASIRTIGGKQNWNQEIWVMTQEAKRKGQSAKRVKIISAWRYPGVTKPGDPPPKEILEELNLIH